MGRQRDWRGDRGTGRGPADRADRPPLPQAPRTADRRLMHWLLVFFGAGLGAVARHGMNRAGLALLGPGFPWWTLGVNVLGSFLIGLLAGLFAGWETGHNARLFLTTGFLGGFT